MSMALPFDEYNRWLCAKCGEAGIDSWNKGIYDGLIHEDDDHPELPHVLGAECTECAHPHVVAYLEKDRAPRIIYGPVPFSAGVSCYEYEHSAFLAFKDDPEAGEPLAPALLKDRDWRGGCMAFASEAVTPLHQSNTLVKS